MKLRCSRCLKRIRLQTMELDDECRPVCSRCYLRYASLDELACARLRNCPTWREALGFNPELEAAQPGHTRGMLLFWLTVVLCAAAYIYLWSLIASVLTVLGGFASLVAMARSPRASREEKARARMRSSSWPSKGTPGNDRL
jgi:hypothetical protein